MEAPETILRTLAVALAVLLGALVLVTGRGIPAALPGALFCLAVAAYFVTSGSGATALGLWIYPLTALCVTKALWSWLFARALFRDGLEPGRWHLLAVLTVALGGVWQQLVFLPLFRAGEASSLETLAGFGFEALLLVFLSLGLREAWREFSTDLVERRRRLRLGIMIGAGVYLSITVAVQSRNLLLDVATPELMTYANMALTCLACLLAAWFLVEPRRSSWLEPVPEKSANPLSPTACAVLSDLKRALEADRVFLREGLTVGDLASQLGTNERVPREAIHEGMGYRNFSDCLHAWRIGEACDSLASPEQARLPVLTIAMNVGYGSIGAFNRAFKARVGMTPTEYRRQAVSGSAPLDRTA